MKLSTPRSRESFVAVDPGLRGTGWAAFRGGKLVAAGVLFCNSPAPFQERAFVLARAVRDRSALYYSSRVVCEYPKFFGSAGGHMVAASGDLLKLTFLVGAIGGACIPLPFIPIGVNDWKGQLPKEVVEERINRRYGIPKMRDLGVKSHAYDAVGIGLYYLREF